MRELGLDLESECSGHFADRLLTFDCTCVSRLTPLDDPMISIKALWADDGVQRAFMMRNRFQVQDSLGYFLRNIERIAAECEKSQVGPFKRILLSFPQCPQPTSPPIPTFFTPVPLQAASLSTTSPTTAQSTGWSTSRGKETPGTRI